MSFKITFFLLLFLIGCGVKTFPVAPEGTKLPTIIDEITSDQNTEKKDDK